MYDKIDRIKFMFKNIQPDFRQLTQLRMLARHLKLKAPVNASMLVTIEKQKAFTVSRCHIRSLAGVFIAESYEDNPIAAFNQISEVINKKLDVWKQRRFIPTDDAG